MPNQSISLNSYDPAEAKVRRAKQLADMLQQQSQQDIPINSYNGIQAPISPLSTLAKILGSYVGYKAGENADTEYADLQTKRQSELAKMLSQQYQVPGQEAQGIKQTDIAPMQTEIGGQKLTLPGIQADPNLGAISNATQARPTTPQEQLANSLAMMGSGNPEAMQIGMPLYQAALQKQQVADLAGNQGPPPGVSPMAWKAALLSGDAEKIATLAQSGMPPKMNPVQQAQYDDFVKSGLSWQDYSARGKAADYAATVPDRIKVAGASAAARAGSAPEAIPIDHENTSIIAQTGLPMGAYKYLIGAPGQPRGQAYISQMDKVLSDWGVKNGIDTASIQPIIQGKNKVLTQNVVRNNQQKILADEIIGSVQNIAPMLDSLSRTKLNRANIIAAWAGKEVNDPQAVAVADQLARLRNEVAGHNAAAGGHLNDNGTPAPTPADEKAAEKTILDGLNSGGAVAIAKSVKMSADKNAVILDNAIDDTNHDIWKLLGVGQYYKRKSPSFDRSLPGDARTVVRTGKDAQGKKVVQYSDGTIEHAP